MNQSAASLYEKISSCAVFSNIPGGKGRKLDLDNSIWHHGYG